eukprot:12400805-Karenia_brevis.AAC.1
MLDTLLAKADKTASVDELQDGIAAKYSDIWKVITHWDKHLLAAVRYDESDENNDLLNMYSAHVIPFQYR